MAYSTGTGANIQDLLSAIQSFAVASCGFTLQQAGSGYLQLHNGICKVAMQSFTVSTNNWTTGSNVPYNDSRLRMALATSFSATTNYFGHTGSLVTSSTSGNRVECNDLVGPYTQWYMFGEPGYCHVVVQSAALRYRHISFGLIDKGDFTHGGVAYCTASGMFVVPQSTTVSQMGHWEPNPNTNNPTPPFMLHGNSITALGSFGAGSYIFAADALPTANQHLAGPTSPGVLPIAITVNDPDATGSGDGYTPLGARLQRGAPTSFGNRAVMFPIPVISLESSTLGRYLGRFPNVRYINMQGVAPGQELAFSGDTWKVFPLLQQNAWGSVVGGLTAPPNTYQYGIAYKKIV